MIARRDKMEATFALLSFFESLKKSEILTKVLYGLRVHGHLSSNTSVAVLELSLQINYPCTFLGDAIHYDMNTTVRTEEEGYTALHIVAACGNKDLARQLISLGADVNEVDTDGWSPLMLVVGDINQPSLLAKKSTLEMCRILLDAGANPDNENDIGVSAITLAREIQDFELILLLETAKQKQADVLEKTVFGASNDPRRQDQGAAKIEIKVDPENDIGASTIQLTKEYKNDELIELLETLKHKQVNATKKPFVDNMSGPYAMEKDGKVEAGRMLPASKADLDDEKIGRSTFWLVVESMYWLVARFYLLIIGI